MNARIPVLVATLVLAWLPAVVFAQQSTAPEPSAVPLGDVARQLRATSGKKSGKVVVNEDLVPVDFSNGAVTTEAASDQAAKSETPLKGKTDQSASSSDPKQRDEEFHRKYLERKRALGLLERELSVTKREFNLQVSEFYGDASTGNPSDARSWPAKRKKGEDDIAEKQKQVDEAKQALENLKEEGRKAGVSPSAFED